MLIFMLVATYASGYGL